MKIVYSKLIILFLVIFFLSFSIEFEASASHNTCWLNAVNDDVSVRVFDVDRAGNTVDGNFYQKYFSGKGKRELYEGKLKKGQTISIKSSNGEVRYDYKASSDYREYGNNTATCSHGEMIRLP